MNGINKSILTIDRIAIALPNRSRSATKFGKLSKIVHEFMNIEEIGRKLSLAKRLFERVL